jgi:hypothetical protein
MGIQIDGVHILISDKYKEMSRRDAVAHMLKEGFVPGETEREKRIWAANAYDLINPKKPGPEEE